MSSSSAPSSQKSKLQEIRAINLKPIEALTWKDVLELLQSGYSIRCSGTYADAIRDVEEECFGDAIAIAAGFGHIIANLEKAGKIEEHNEMKEILQGHLASVEGQNITIAWLMSNLNDANSKSDAKKDRVAAREQLLKTLSEYSAEDRTAIAAAVQTGLEITVLQGGERETTAWTFVRGNMNAIDMKAYGGFGKNGKRNIPRQEFYPAILVADKEATPEQILAGLIVISAEIAKH